jgi:ABC-2 type transport system permease protein
MKVQLFRHVLSIEARKLMSYRIDFWINSVLGSLAQFLLVYSLWAAIIVEPGELKGGYSFDGIVLYYVLVILLGRLVGNSFSQNDVSQDIYDGTLSRYLLFPSSYFVFKYAQRLGATTPTLVQIAVLGLIYLLVLPFPKEVQVTLTSFTMGVMALFVASLLFYSISWLLQLVAFWADNVWSLVVMMIFVARLLGGAMIPLAMFPDWSQTWLTVLPFRYFYGFPVDTIMGRVSPAEWSQGMAISILWFFLTMAISRIVWRRGMLSYSGVGI